MPDIDDELRELEAKYRQKMTLDLIDHGYETKDALVLPGLPWLCERLKARLDAQALRYDERAADAADLADSQYGRTLHYIAMVTRLKKLVDKMLPEVSGTLLEQAMLHHWMVVCGINYTMHAGRA
jgi:hypothetical protein